MLSPQEALELDIVDSLYDGTEDLEKQIKAFVEKYDLVSGKREAIKTNKEFTFYNLIKSIEKSVFTADEVAFFTGDALQG